MNYKSLPIGEKYPERVTAVIENPKGTHNKYELDEELNVIKLDRVLHTAMFWPFDYGFIPQTLSGDGDPLDVMVLTDSPTFPGCVVEIRPIGVLITEDEKGQDEKLLAVQTKNPHYSEIDSLEKVPAHILKEIAHFYEEMKKLEPGKWVKVKGWEPKEKALTIIREAHENYTKKK